MKNQIAQDLRSWAQGLSINYIPSVPPGFMVAQYNLRSVEELKAKLEEFPHGSRFFLPKAEPGASEEQLAAVQQILDITEKAGLVITRAPEPNQN
jgi:hypothetical protein